MNVTVYGDFNSLLSYLASQRADWLVRTVMAEIDWRAVEHCRQMPNSAPNATPSTASASTMPARVLVELPCDWAFSMS